MDTFGDNCKISILNDYCLLEIFSYLNDFDLRVIEKVNLHWQQLAQKCYELTTRINIRELQELNTKRLTKEDFREIVSRYSNLRAIDRMSEFYDTDDEFLQILGTCCPKLNELKVRNAGFSDEGFLSLSKKCRKLQAIELGFTSKVTAKGICGLLEANPEVSQLTLRIQHWQELTMREERFQVVKRLPKLQELTVVNVKLIDELHSSLRTTCCGRRIPLYSTSTLRHHVDLQGIKFLKQLRVLKMEECLSDMGDDMFMSIMKECTHLETIHIPDCDVTNVSLKSCKRIKDLFIGSPKVTNRGLCTLATKGVLEIFTATQLPNVTSGGLITFIELCSTLKRICLGRINHREKLLEVALRRVERRHNGPELHIELPYFDTYLVKLQHPLLKFIERHQVSSIVDKLNFFQRKERWRWVKCAFEFGGVPRWYGPPGAMASTIANSQSRVFHQQ